MAQMTDRVVRSVDRFQQRHRPFAVAFGVIKKFGDDRGGALAGLLAFYGFLAIFPLLLFLTTVLGYVLRGHSSLAGTIENSALRDFPIIGTQLGHQIAPLKGNGLAIAVGLVGLLWGSLGVTQTAQHTMAQVWNVPGVERPGYVPRLVRGILLLATIGVGVLGSTVLASVSTLGSAGVPIRVVGVVGSLALNVGLFVIGFRVLTPRQVATRGLLPGAVLAGVGWSVLQALGAYLVGHQLRHASQVYGFFGSVLGLIWWLQLATQLTVYSAELNVVRARHLWPRSLVQPPLTAADEAALAALAQQEERRPEEQVQVTFRTTADPPIGR
jgi:YihY family inner membrane protein